MTKNKLVLVFLALGVAACEKPAPEMSPAGFQPERLARIGNAVEQAVEAGEIPGAVVLVARGGKTHLHEAYGYADLDSETAMTTDTIFRIASMTKAVTTAGVMILYEQGHFQLNDPVADYLPAFRDMRVVEDVGDDGTVASTVEAGSPIRIIHLLTHTSGLAYPFIQGELQRTYRDAGVIDGLTTDDLTLASQMALLAQQPLLFEPGERFNYGLNTDVLGYLIEVVSGQPLDEFFAEHISGPLGMTDTHFYLPKSKAGRLATLYAHAPDKGLVEAHEVAADIELDDQNYPVTGARTYFSGGAGLSSTARDYARFLQMLLNDGELDGTRVLSRKSVELMRAPRVDQDGDQRPDIGLGFWIVTDVGRQGELGSVGTYSWGGAFYTSYWVDPQEDLVGVFMSQARPVQSSVASRFNTLVYQALE